MNHVTIAIDWDEDVVAIACEAPFGGKINPAANLARAVLIRALPLDPRLIHLAMSGRKLVPAYQQVTEDQHNCVVGFNIR